jgi:hypothetical protein
MNGKEILIGVYNDSIIFPTLPGGLRQLVVRISCDLVDRITKETTLSLKDPNGNRLSEQKIDLAGLSLDEHNVVGLIIQGINFYAAGTYSIEVSTEGSEIKKISDFEVRLPKSDEERKRVPSPS